MALIATGWACGSGSPTEPAGRPTRRTSKVADVAAKVAQVAAAVTGQKAQLADDYEKGHYVGFDTHTYPGTATMKAWKNTPGAPYSWVGYYLPSPCHADKSWIGKRDTLAYDRLGHGDRLRRPADLGQDAARDDRRATRHRSSRRRNAPLI